MSDDENRTIPGTNQIFADMCETSPDQCQPRQDVTP